MLVKRDFTSNDTNLNPSSNNFLGTLLIETASKVSLIVNSLVVKGFKRLVTRYLATGW